MYGRREVYANAPLILVVAEVRITYSPRLRRQNTLDEILLELDDTLPVVKQLQQANIQVGPDRVEQHGDMQSQFALLNRSSTVAATISSTAVILEATEYTEFPDFKDLYLRVCRAIERKIGSSAVERIGLRYIDEIRVPEPIDDARDWRGWVADPLVDIFNVASSGVASDYQGLITYDLGSGCHLNFRSAALHGTGIVGNDPLRRRHVQSQSGPYFVLDLDGYWEGGESHDFDLEWIGNILESLHTSTGEAFQNAITDRARTFFREVPDAPANFTERLSSDGRSN